MLTLQSFVVRHEISLASRIHTRSEVVKGVAMLIAWGRSFQRTRRGSTLTTISLWAVQRDFVPEPRQKHPFQRRSKLYDSFQSIALPPPINLLILQVIMVALKILLALLWDPIQVFQVKPAQVILLGRRSQEGRGHRAIALTQLAVRFPLKVAVSIPFVLKIKEHFICIIICSFIFIPVHFLASLLVF